MHSWHKTRLWNCCCFSCWVSKGDHRGPGKVIKPLLPVNLPQSKRERPLTLPLLVLSGHVSSEKMMPTGPSFPHIIRYWTGFPQEVFFNFIEIRFFSHTLHLNFSFLFSIHPNSFPPLLPSRMTLYLIWKEQASKRLQ